MSVSRDIGAAIGLLKPYTEEAKEMEDDRSKKKGTPQLIPLANDAIKKLEILKVKVDMCVESTF